MATSSYGSPPLLTVFPFISSLFNLFPLPFLARLTPASSFTLTRKLVDVPIAARFLGPFFFDLSFAGAVSYPSRPFHILREE